MPREAALEERFEKIEKYVRNMRLAVIFIVAFFVYDALTESGILGRESFTSADTVRARELLIVSERGASMLRIGTDANQQIELIIDNEAGERLRMDAGALSLLQTGAHQQRVRRLRLEADELKRYDMDGNELKPVF